MNESINILLSILQKKDHKLAIETLKGSLDNNGMSEEYNDVLKSYLDLGYALFEEHNYEKATLQCMNLYHLVQKCHITNS